MQGRLSVQARQAVNLHQQLVSHVLLNKHPWVDKVPLASNRCRVTFFVFSVSVAAGRVASFRVGILPSAAAARHLKQRTRGVSSTLPSTIPCRMAVLPVS